jgi:carboxylesterase
MPNDRESVAVMPGAEPFSAPGGPHGALVLHGFTGTPQSMRGLAKAFATEGYAVELPRLPGHGTSVDDMATTTFADWSGAVEHAYNDLSGRCDRIVVAGLSMGATLAAWLERSLRRPRGRSSRADAPRAELPRRDAGLRASRRRSRRSRLRRPGDRRLTAETIHKVQDSGNRP